MGWLVGLGLLGAAIARELRMPPGEREWHGRIAGLVPYDLGPPTVERLRGAWWDPAGPLFTGQPFGVGWTVNLARAAGLFRAQTPR